VGKGSKPRPLSVSSEQFGSNWDNIFDKERGAYHSFCRRMWLDYCDEFSSFGSTALDYDTYVREYKDSLLKKFNKSK